MTTTDRVPTADDRDRIARCLRALTDSTGALSVAAAVRDGESTFILVSEIEALLDIAEAAEAAAEEARGEMGGTAADRRAFRADYPAAARLADLFPARDTGIE